VTAVMIGVDPHKGSHTATALDATEHELACLRVRAGRRQVEQLLAWATPFAARTWAIESANGLGYLLAPAACRCRRGGVGRARHVGCQGAGAVVGPVE
jgi:hypothetical protein